MFEKEICNSGWSSLLSHSHSGYNGKRRRRRKKATTTHTLQLAWIKRWFVLSNSHQRIWSAIKEKLSSHSGTTLISNIIIQVCDDTKCPYIGFPYPSTGSHISMYEGIWSTFYNAVHETDLSNYFKCTFRHPVMKTQKPDTRFLHLKNSE